jgi:stage II sporulation protein P
MDVRAIHLSADGVIATKRIWVARPFLVAYVVAVGFTVGLLVNRNPGGDPVVPAMAGGQVRQQVAAEREREALEPPLWLQLFRPSQPTARLMLRLGLPVLTVIDGSAQEQESRNLKVFWTGQAVERPQTLFQSMLPFLRPAEPQVAAGPAPAPPTTPKVVMPSQVPPPAVVDNPQATSDPAPAPVAKPVDQKPDSKPPVVNGGRPLVGIYNTHDWESYVSEFPAMATPQNDDDLKKIQSFSHKQRTVMDIGKAVAQRLKELGVTSVYADATHQSLGYDYAYTASRETAQEILKKQPSVKILMDLHRDGTWGLDTTANINGKRVAKIRCIIGDREQPNWSQNKAFCDQLMGRLEKKYPGLTLPTRVQNDRYNQDLMPGAILLEVGGALNSYAEAERAGLYLTEGLAEAIRAGEYPK